MKKVAQLTEAEKESITLAIRLTELAIQTNFDGDPYQMQTALHAVSYILKSVIGRDD